MTKYVLSSESFDDFYQILEDMNNLEDDFESLYEKYSDQKLASFFWFLGGDGKEKLVLFYYLVAKWMDKKISRRDQSIREKINNLFSKKFDEFGAISFEDIDEDFIYKMLERNITYTSLEDGLIELLGEKI